MMCVFSIKYVMVEPSELKKYGLVIALTNQIERDVSKILFDQRQMCIFSFETG